MDKTYNLKFHGIELVEKEVGKGDVLPTDIFNFDVRTQSAVDSTRSLIIIFVSVSIRKNSEEKNIAKLTCAFGFQIEEYENIVIVDENKVAKIPSDLENLLKNISISTIRGILFSELSATKLRGAIMPIILADSMKPLSENIIEFSDTTK